MRIQTASVQHYSLGLWIVALALVAAAGLATGRWMVPAGDTTAPAPATSDAFSAFDEVEAGSPGLGHVIGMTFEQPAALAGSAVGVPADPSSLGEGHVIGITFASGTVDGFAAADPDSPGEGHVIGMTFQ